MQQPGCDRRRSYRAAPKNAFATVRAQGGVATCAVADLSAGGALLEGRAAAKVGERVELRLRLLSGEFAVTARVLRLRPGRDRTRVALAFDPTAALEDALEEVIVADLARRRRPLAVIAGRSRVEARPLARSLRFLGHRVVLASTPLELIHHLEGESHRVDTVLLAANLGHASGIDVARFLADAYPRVRRVLVEWNGRARRAFADVVHTVLPAPWSAELVRAALEHPGG